MQSKARSYRAVRLLLTYALVVIAIVWGVAYLMNPNGGDLAGAVRDWYFNFWN